MALKCLRDDKFAQEMVSKGRFDVNIFAEISPYVDVCAWGGKRRKLAL